MNKTVMTVAAFIAGAAAGAVGSWYILKTKYEQIANEEIESVKEVYSRNFGKSEEVPPEEKEEPEETEDEKLYKKAVEVLDYSQFSKSEKPKEEPIVEDKKEQLGKEGPYVIPPEEFGEFDDYDQISLTFYSDHILADDGDEIVEDVDRIVGFESLTHFGEYEDDSVFVRNDELKCDYEILLDPQKYVDAMAGKPYRKGVL